MTRLFTCVFFLLSSLGFQQTLQAQCGIFDLTATPGDCDGDSFFVTIDFQYFGNGSDSFKVQGNGQIYGNFNYNDLPVTIGPLAGNGVTVYEFVAKDLVQPDCSDFAVAGPVFCGVSDCLVHELVADPGDCNADGTYNLWINFQYQNAGNAFFEVFYEGENIGFFPLSELPVVIPHFQDNGETVPVITVCINDVPDCCAETEFEAPDCMPPGDCHIFDIIAEAHPCIDGHFLLDFAFQYQNTGTQGFTVKAGGQILGEFEYGETFYTIGPLPANMTFEIVIKDKQFPDCKGVIVFGPVNCGSGTDCQISGLVAENSDCDEEGQFFVTLDFEHSGTGNDGFKVFGNGNVYGFFGYGELPVTIGPFESNVDELEFIVADVQQPDCRDAAEVYAPNCNAGGDCHISNLAAEVHPCLSNGTFFVTLDFDHENNSGHFKVQGNGVVYGIFSYNDLPVSIGPLVGNGTTNYGFLVRDLHFENCAQDIGVGTVECPSGGDCHIVDLVADAGECHNDETYNLWINFDFENATNNFYDVFHNGELVDYFPLAHIPVVLPHVPGNGEPVQSVTVCINDNPGCCATFEYEAPDCEEGLLVWPGDANADQAADHFDLLNLGLAFGAEGPARQVQGFEWTGLGAANWSQSFTDQLNFKHADCNGDGKVTVADLQVLEENFGQTNGTPQPPVFIGGTENDPPFYIDLAGAGSLSVGVPFTAPLILGNADLPVQNLYGIAFTLKFDPQVIDPESIQLQYDPSWLGVMNVNLMTIDKTLAADGLVKMALVRTDQNNVSGHGQIAALIGIIDNIAGKESVSMEILDVRAIRENEVLVPLFRPVQEINLTTGTTENTANGQLRMFPNPAGSSVFIDHPDGLPLESIEVSNLNGQVLVLDRNPGNRLDISHLVPGVYTLKVKTGEHFFMEKLVKL